MIKQEELKLIFERCQGNIETFVQVVRAKYDTKKSSLANVFTIARNLGVRIILADLGEDAAQLITNKDGEKAYIVLHYNSNIERLRLNAAIMIYHLFAKRTGIDETVVKNKDSNDEEMKKAKHF